MDEFKGDSSDMGNAIAELTRRVVKIRPVMLEMTERNRRLESEFQLMAAHISLVEDAVGDLERMFQLHCMHRAEDHQDI